MEYSQQVRIVHADAHYVAATWSRVGIAVWRTQTKVDAVNRLATMLGPLSEVYPKIGLIQLIDDGCEGPDADARAALNHLLKETPKLSYSAVVYEGDGFRAASVRAIVAGLAALARAPFPHRVFASVPEAVDAMSVVLEAREPSALSKGLRDAIGKVRAHGEPRLPSQRPRSGRPSVGSLASQLLRKR